MVLSCLYGVQLAFHLKKKKRAAIFALFYACVVVTLGV